MLVMSKKHNVDFTVDINSLFGFVVEDYGVCLLDHDNEGYVITLTENNNGYITVDSYDRNICHTLGDLIDNTWICDRYKVIKVFTSSEDFILELKY